MRLPTLLGAGLVALAAAHAARAAPPASHLPAHFIIERGADAWSGRLRAQQFLPTLATPDAPLPPDAWEAAQWLDTAPPDARQLWTFRTDGAHVPTALHWNMLSPAQQIQLNASDDLGALRIDYLRGVRLHESKPPQLRARSGVLGAMQGARVQLIGPPGFVPDDRHTAFRRQHIHRPWMVYVGANDGLLHGFDALTGQERFAIMSDAALPAAARNASPGQAVARPVCSRPFAADTWTGTQWRSVLACANGTMARGLFLADITDPASTAPKSWLAYDAGDDAAIGYMEGPVPVVPLADDSGTQSRWFAVSGNGFGDTGMESRLLLLALDQPSGSAWQPGRTAYAIAIPRAVSLGGLGAPAIALGPNGRATFAYADDTQGQIWRFDLRGTAPWTQALGRNDAERRQPFFTATALSGQRQRIAGPILLAATAGGPMLVFTAVDTNGAVTLYGVMDKDHTQRNIKGDALADRKAVETEDGVTLHPGDGRTPAAGWRIDLPASHRPDDLAGIGTRALLLTMLDTQGRYRAYLLDPLTGLPANPSGRTGHVLTSPPRITTQSAPATTGADGSTTQTTHTRLWRVDGAGAHKIETHTHTRKLGRLSWREVVESGVR